MKDLVPVSQLTSVIFVMMVTPSLPARSLADVLALARDKPGALTCASGGGMSQLACEMIRVLGKVDVTYVPYKGLAPAMTDSITGENRAIAPQRLGVALAPARLPDGRSALVIVAVEPASRAARLDPVEALRHE